MPLIALKFTNPMADAESLANLLSETFWPMPLSVSVYEIVEHETWGVEAHFEADPGEQSVREFFGRNLAPGLPAPDFTLAPVEDKDWVRQSLAGLKPVTAGRIFVHGAHDRGKIPATAIGVEIDAGQAFGTGHHETTKACLLALGQITSIARPNGVLDVGTGSGVLAIAAAKLLKSPIVATDIDPIAVAVALNNARLNEVAPLITGVAAHGVRNERVDEAGPYDLILANILARPLSRMAGDIASQLALGGHLVLSGILNHQAQMVASAYRAQGIVLRRRLRLGDWTTLILQG